MGQNGVMARTAWVVWYCVSLHVWWGAMLLVDARASGVTAINDMTRLTGSVRASAVVYLSVGVLAAVGLLRARPGSIRGLLELLPQQAVLLISAFGACEAVWKSTYADGVLRPRAFIAADQVPAVFIALAHTATLVHCYVRGSGRSRA